MQRWTVGVEYDHLFMGTANNTFAAVNAGPGVGLISGDRVSQDVDMVTLRFNYRFGGHGGYGGYGAPY